MVTAAFNAENLPLGQASQSVIFVDPMVELKLPLGHAMHDSGLDAPD